MPVKVREFYCNVDDALYKVVENDDSFQAFVLQSDGQLREVNPGRILANGVPVEEEEFAAEVTKRGGQHPQVI